MTTKQKIRSCSNTVAFLYTDKNTTEIKEEIANTTGYHESLVHVLTNKGDATRLTIVSMPQDVFDTLSQTGLFNGSCAVQPFRFGPLDCPRAGYSHRNLFLPIKSGYPVSKMRKAVMNRLVQLEKRGFVPPNSWTVTNPDSQSNKMFVYLRNIDNIKASLIRRFVNDIPIRNEDQMIFIEAYWAQERNLNRVVESC